MNPRELFGELLGHWNPWAEHAVRPSKGGRGITKPRVGKSKRKHKRKKGGSSKRASRARRNKKR